MYKLIALDLDGTLKNSKKEILPYTKEVLIEVQKKGIKLILASGRPTYGVLPTAKELQMDKFGGYILSYNGGNVSEYGTNRGIYNNFISFKETKELYKVAKENGFCIMSYYNDCVITETDWDKYIIIESEINNMKIQHVNNFVEFINYNVPKFIITGEPRELVKKQDDIRRLFEGRLNIYRSEPFFLEVLPLNIDKAFSLNMLLNYLNYQKEDLIAFGDGYNDISMIQYAGMGVAMQNAQQDLKNVADYITLSNDEDGIAYALKKFFGGDYEWKI